MGDMIRLASGGREISAYRAKPAGAPKGGIVVIQEIFGVNSHVKNVADGYAADGYEVIAPALFDRIRPGVELGYGEADLAAGFALRQQVSLDQALEDIGVAVAELQRVLPKVGTVGYCWGGTLSYAAATALPVAAAVSYYGGGVADVVAQRKPHAPVLFHFGDRDHYISMEQVEAVRQALPAAEIYIYHADHGFNCDQRGSYDAESARLARQRSLDFFARHLG